MDPESRRNYDARYASIKRAAQSKPKPRAPETPSSQDRDAGKEAREKKQRAALRAEKLRELGSRKARLESEVFEEKRALNKLKGELSTLQEEIDKEAREQAAKGGWWGYLGSYVTGKAGETEEEKAERERRQLDRSAAQTIKEKLLERQNTKVEHLEARVRGTDDEIGRVRRVILEEEQEEERVRQREEQRKRAEAEEKMRADFERRQREWEASMREERRRAAEAGAQRRRQQAEEQRRRQQAEAEEEEKRKRRAEDRPRREKMRTKSQRAGARQTSTKASCDHRGWWSQVEGSHVCCRCSTTTRRFAFQCPTCNSVACASCRKILKATRSSQFGSEDFRKRNDGYDSRWSPEEPVGYNPYDWD